MRFRDPEKIVLAGVMYTALFAVINLAFRIIFGTAFVPSWLGVLIGFGAATCGAVWFRIRLPGYFTSLWPEKLKEARLRLLTRLVVIFLLATIIFPLITYFLLP